MEQKVYFGSWDGEGYERMKSDFSDYSYSTHSHVEIPDFPPPEAILLASYGGASYEGDALVLFERDGKLYEVSGSHCSCNGLEDQWTPCEVTWPALKARVDTAAANKAAGRSWRGVLDDHEDEAFARFCELVAEHTATNDYSEAR